ncbi:ankyrin [Wilcoxina mikolae CBS 423.85]|nr:ankyrin [Wilcoxina mikolae CBS 423.85]
MTVPFGFSIGDFIAVGDLALRLYRQCYLVARNAPHEFQILTKELGTLHTTVLVLREEVVDPDSVLVKSGEDRIRMVNEMIDRVKDTLNAMEKFAAKYGKLMDKDRAKWKHRWDKFKWSLEASELDGLRNKLIYHNGVLSLLLTSAGNSSLQRLESTSQKIESGVNEIKDYLQRSGTGDLSSPPTVTASVGDNLSKISFSQILMRNAEITSKWTSIGIEDWIRAGRWWLLKSQMELHSSNAVSRQGYLNLIKASWILVDIVVRHPQLSFLDSTIRLEVSLLTEAINGEFQRLKGLGLQLPGLDDLDSSSDDLRIWEAQVKGPSFQPGGKSKTQKSSWEVLDEHIHFQKFARYIYGQDHQQVPCLVLFLAHKKQKQARLVVYDQNWVTLAEFQAETLNRTSQARTEYVFPDPKIMLPHADDSKLLCIFLEASEEHLAYDALPNNLETFYAFCLLIAIKRGASDCFERWFTDKRPSPPPVVPLLEQANNLEMWFRDHSPPKWKQDEYLGYELKSIQLLQGRSLVLWLVNNGFFEAARVLLEARNVLIPNDCDIFQLLSPLHSETTGYYHVVKLLLEEGMNPNETIPKWDGYSKDWTVLQVAAMGGHQDVVEKLLKAGADVNALPAEYKGRTALQAAAEGGHQVVVEQLLKAGADVNAPSAEYGETALQAAAGGGHQAVVEQLLKAGSCSRATPESWRRC